MGFDKNIQYVNIPLNIRSQVLCQGWNWQIFKTGSYSEHIVDIMF